FQGVGIPSASALRLYKAYGKDSMELIRENPYRLVEEVYGIGFKKADEIAGKMGINGDSPFRIKSGIKYCLMFFISDGNTYMPQDELCERVAQLLDLTRDQVYECLVEMAFTGDVKVEDLDDIKVVYLYSYYAAEQKVCANIADIARGELKVLSVDIDKTIALTEKASGVELSEQQKAAVKKSLTSGLSVITGGPGTGKTTIINTIINIFEESDLKVAIAAPTGRAAKRITETSGHYASTIHRLLEYYYSEDTADMQFGKTAEDPLDFDAVIVDEASMIDLMLMQGLTEAIKPGTRLVMVGDSDQLPSVGAGNVLLDIIQCGFIQTSKLTEIFRQAEESMIVVNAHRINHGEYPEINGRNTDFFFMERNNERDILDLMIQLVTKRLPDYYDGIDKLSDIQVLTPTRKGMIGTASLNEALQQAFNPPRAGVQEKKYRDHILRTGDKVMQIRNNYQLAYKIPGSNEDGQGIFNGDVGFIKAVDNEYGKVTVIYDDEKYVEYDFTQLDELELAYAVTVHKSQGSEFPIVVMPVSWFPPMLATRNLLYTAVTRGKRVVVLVGMENRLDAMVDNDRIKMRYSGLRPRLEKLLSLES
ncbi:SF1B family DNA helicase RecD2, partial [Aminicella lysinilytica]|uniref:SF1B family DNA helicase RecD2 n=1 Tax=Aminicella lysinilytica TaxID=433323 RepID=UPI0026F2980E